MSRRSIGRRRLPTSQADSLPTEARQTCGGSYLSSSNCYGPELVQPVSGIVRGATAPAVPAAVKPVNAIVRGATAAEAPAAVKPANVMVRGATAADAPAAVKPASVMVLGNTATDEPLAVKPASVIVRGVVPSDLVTVFTALLLIGDTTAPDNTDPFVTIAVAPDVVPPVTVAVPVDV